MAAWYLLQLLDPSEKTIETTIESDDGTALDDIVQRRAAITEYVQVKWGADEPALPLGVNSLTDGGAKSIVAKVAAAWRNITAPVQVVLWTNRGAAPDLLELLDGRRIRRRDALQPPAQARWDALQTTSGLDRATFERFAADVDVRSDASDQDSITAHIEQRLRDLGISELKDRLLTVVREAATYRHQPFTRADLVAALRLGPQRELSENLGPPEFGYIERPELEADVGARIRSAKQGYVVILGSPGAGKSAFLRVFLDHLPDDIVLVSKHYSYLPDATYGPERVYEERVLETLLAQIQRTFGREEIRVTAEAFYSALRDLSDQFRAKGEVGIVVLDALEELVAYRDVPVRLLDTLLPDQPPPGIVFVVSAQSEAQLPLRLHQHAQETLVVGPLTTSQAQQLVQATGVQTDRAGKGWPPLTKDEIADLAEKAGRLPLLLIMLARRFMFVEDVSAGLASEPQSDGDVRRTFGNLWDRSNADAKMLLAILATADTPLSRTELRDIAGITEPQVWDAIRSVRHALTDDLGSLRPYHRFLSTYVAEREPEQAQAAAGLVADLWGPDSDDSRATRRRWPLLIRSGRGDEVVAEFSEDLADRWLLLGAPVAVIERNADLAVEQAVRRVPDDVHRVAVLRTILAQRLEDLPSDDYTRALGAVRGMDGLVRHTYDAGQPTGDRAAASIASLALWRAGRREEAETLLQYALRPEERGETSFAYDELADAFGLLVHIGPSDFEDLVRWAPTGRLPPKWSHTQCSCTCCARVKSSRRTARSRNDAGAHPGEAPRAPCHPHVAGRK